MPNLIDSKTKRAKLAPRREPYWHTLQKGAAVGFRRLENGDGTWIARWRDEAGKQRYRALGNLDDFDVAAKTAREWVTTCEQGAAPTVTTVSEACKSYVMGLKAEGRPDTAYDAERRFMKRVFDSAFGKIPLDKLKTSNLQTWMNEQINDDEDADDEDIRRSKDSANRNLATLKAALNKALNHRLVATDAGWKTIKAFPKVAARRKDAFLSMAQRKALLEACPDDLSLLVKAMLLTGARPGELAKLNTADFDKRLSCLTLTGKTGPRTVAVSAQAAAFFSEQIKGKLPSAPMLCTAFGERWDKERWGRPFKDIVKCAGLPETVVLYSLRHTAISEMILAGMDSFIVATLAGTSVEMIEKNYGHLKHSVVSAMLNRVAMI